ncbi:hypothetical protein ACHAXS_006014 [Conticribra weissflogii]
MQAMSSQPTRQKLNSSTTAARSASLWTGGYYHQDHNEQLFRQKVHSALHHVRTLLNPDGPHTLTHLSNHSNRDSSSSKPKSRRHNQRDPVYFAEYKNHTYNDTFRLAEYLTNVAIASQMNVLDAMGVDEDTFQWMYGIATTGAPMKAESTPKAKSTTRNRRASLLGEPMTSICSGTGHAQDAKPKPKKSKFNRVVMRFVAEENCSFHKEEEVYVDSTKDVADHSEHGENNQQSSHDGHTPKTLERIEKQILFRRPSKYVPKDRVKEYRWKVSINYSIQILAAECLEGDDNLLNKKTANSKSLRSSHRRDDQVFMHSTSLTSEQKGPPPPPPLTLQSRTATTEIVTTAYKTCPLPSKTVCPPIDVDITWLFQHISSEDFNCNFQINRNHQNCFTPRRNACINEAMKYFSDMSTWCDKICSYFLKGTAWNSDSSNRKNPNHSAMKEKGDSERRATSLESINAGSVFVPVLPLFEDPSTSVVRKGQENGISEKKEQNGASALTPLLPIKDVRLFLNEQCRTLDEKIGEIVVKFPPADSKTKLVTSAEASIVLLACHSAIITQYYMDAVQSIEAVMGDFLKQAIGLNLTEHDFLELVQIHEKNIFKQKYRPKPFCRAIRRPKRFPDGSIIIAAEIDEKIASVDRSGWSRRAENEEGKDEVVSLRKTVTTLVREMQWSHEFETDESIGIEMPIDESTTVHLTGKCYLHGWISHQFEGECDHRYRLIAKAHRFSSFLLVIGSITASRIFEPKDALIVQKNDEFILPLILRTLPLSDDFDDLVCSLSPEQQRFARSAREGQTESSLFGVCVVEIRPQLEELLGLQVHSLTKEIRLTERLISLFVDYQIPPDMIAYDGPDNSSTKVKISSVKDNVVNALDIAKDCLVAGVDVLQDDDSDTVISADLTDNISSEQFPRRPSMIRQLSLDNYSRRPSQYSVFPDMSFDQGSEYLSLFQFQDHCGCDSSFIRLFFSNINPNRKTDIIGRQERAAGATATGATATITATSTTATAATT